MVKGLSLVCLVVCFVSVSYALYPSKSDVIELTPSNFDELVINSDEVWIVEFYSPFCSYCQALVPEYLKAATALKGVVKVGSVNGDEYRAMVSQYGVHAFPTIKVFGGDKNKPEDFYGQRTAQSIVDAGLKAAGEKAPLKGWKKSIGSLSDDDENVIQLTDDNFDNLVLKSDDIWLVAFFAPWCGHSKTLAPNWAKAAQELKGKVKFGALDATVHKVKAAQYGIYGFPIIKYFLAGPKSNSSAQDYYFGRAASDIVSWANIKFKFYKKLRQYKLKFSSKTHHEVIYLGNEKLWINQFNARALEAG